MKTDYVSRLPSFLLAGICILMSSAKPAAAQTQSTYEKLEAQVDSVRADIQSLETILAELNQLDSAYSPSFPRWEMNEPNLRLRVNAAFRNRGKQISPDAKIFVTTLPDTQTIIDIRAGDVSYGKLYAQTLLARDLKTDLLAEARANEPPLGVMNHVYEESNPMAHPTKPDWISADVSLFGGSIRFGNDWGFEGKIGEDELGYPFWSTGNARVMAIYKSLKIGGWLPINGGLDDQAASTGKRTRLLNGSDGVVGEFEFEWETIRINSPSFPYAAIGGNFAFGKMSGRREEFMTRDLNRLYYFSAIVQGYYAFDFLFDQHRQNLNFHLGASYNKVSVGRAVNVDELYQILDAGDPESFVDPYIRIEYRNYRFDRFRITAQYSRLAMFKGWAEIVPPFVYIELKFSSVVFRDPRPWEYQNYFYGTLGFKFDF